MFSGFWQIWRKFSVLGALLAILAGCSGRSVDVVQPHLFKIMADRMSEELIARNILDNSRAYVAGFWSAPAAYGTELFQRLSPDCLFEDTVTVLPGSTFSLSTKHSDKVLMSDAGFIISGMRQTITVNMIAITDWDGDGRKDWLVSCLVETPRGGKNRDYYVVIADPPDEGALRGLVVAVYEFSGLVGRLYLRENRTAAEATRNGDTAVLEESVPGLRPITAPPQGAPSRGGGVQERPLD